MDPTPSFAWCFSHGRMHTFWPGRDPWCTARWVVFPGATEEAALEAKRARYGEAQFMHHLPPEVQVEIIHEREDG